MVYIYLPKRLADCEAMSFLGGGECTTIRIIRYMYSEKEIICFDQAILAKILLLREASLVDLSPGLNAAPNIFKRQSVRSA